MCGDFSSMSSIDADKTERAVTKLKQIFGCKLRGIAFVNYEAVCVCMPAAVSLEALKIARSGVIDVQVLM